MLPPFFVVSETLLVNFYRMVEKIMKQFSCLLIIPISFIIFISCSRAVKEDEAIKNIIGKYNYALAIAYKDGKFGLLQEVASGQAFNIVSHTYESSLNGEGIVLDAELLGMTFKKITLGSGENEPRIDAVWHEREKEWREVYIFEDTFAETTEQWKYKWVNAKTGKIVPPIMTIRYEMAYTLKQKDGKWKVISTEIKEQKIEKSEGGKERDKGSSAGH